MELREAIAEVQGIKKQPWNWRVGTIDTILNAVADGTLIPADAVFQAKDGYMVKAYNNNRDCTGYASCNLSEALEIRSADDVRREAVQQCITELSEGYLNGDGLPAMVKRMSALIDTPQPKGGDDE